MDVLLRVKGELVPVGFPIRILNLNRTGFAVISETRFRPGERLHLRLKGPGVADVEVTAAAVHTQPSQTSPGIFMTGFEFLPDRSGDRMSEMPVRDLLTAVAPAGFKI